MTKQSNNTPDDSLQQPELTRLKGHWMPMYWADYFGDTQHLDTIEHGAYLLLIAAYWRRGGPLLNDDRYLSRIAKLHGNRWRKISKTVKAFFFEKDGHLHHKRLDLELVRSSKRIAAALRANSVRWSGRTPNHNHNHNHKSISKEIAEPAVQPENVSHEAKKGTSDGIRGTRLPEDWLPSPEVHLFAVGLLGETGAAYQLEKFRDYWLGKAGAAARKTDWDRTFRNWCRSAKERKGNGYHRNQTLKERTADALQRLGSGSFGEIADIGLPKLNPE